MCIDFEFMNVTRASHLWRVETPNKTKSKPNKREWPKKKNEERNRNAPKLDTSHSHTHARHTMSLREVIWLNNTNFLFFPSTRCFYVFYAF